MNSIKHPDTLDNNNSVPALASYLAVFEHYRKVYAAPQTVFGHLRSKSTATLPSIHTT
jgi:hypothetical protein